MWIHVIAFAVSPPNYFTMIGHQKNLLLSHKSFSGFLELTYTYIIYILIIISQNISMCHPLHNHGSRRPASIANRSNTILSGEQLMQERSQDSRS